MRRGMQRTSRNVEDAASTACLATACMADIPPSLQYGGMLHAASCCTEDIGRLGVTVPVLLEEAAVVLWNCSQSATAAARCHVARCMLYAACCCMLCVVHVTCCMRRADRPALRSEDVLVERRQRERCSGARAREELQLDASRLHSDSAHAYTLSHTPASALDRKRSRRMRRRRQTCRRARTALWHECPNC
jgi:hypothetical protein